MATPDHTDAEPTTEWSTRDLTTGPLAVAIGALVLVGGIAAWSGAGVVLQRPLWLDEIVTQLVATAPRGIVQAMRSGVDFQPPTDYALVRLAGTLLGGASLLSARLPSLLAAMLTVMLLGAALRARVSAAAALAGALALAAHPLFIGQAFEARPYALWILASLLTALALRAAPPRRAYLAAIAAVALCTSHYFGILSLAIIFTAAAAYHRFGERRSWTATARAVAPLAAGGAALLALLPLARAQLATTGGRSWAPPVTMGNITYFLGFIWGWRPAVYLIVAGACFVAVRHAIPRFRRPPGERAPSLDVTTVALLSTAAVPVLVVLISLALTPVIVLRYSAPALLAMATLCALAVEQMPRHARWLALLLLARAALFSYQSASASAAEGSASLAQEASAVHRIELRGIPTVSAFRHDAYQASWVAGGGSVAWIDLPDSLIDRAAATAPAQASRDYLLVERGFGRAVAREFRFPVVKGIDAVRAHPVVALLRDASMAPTDSLWLPGRPACPLSPRLVVYARTGVALSCEALQRELQGASTRR